jgi:hypothetical protein
VVIKEQRFLRLFFVMYNLNYSSRMYYEYINSAVWILRTNHSMLHIQGWCEP